MFDVYNRAGVSMGIVCEEELIDYDTWSRFWLLLLSNMGD